MRSKALVLALLMVWGTFFCGCESEREKRNADEREERVLIVTASGGVEEQTALIISELLQARDIETVLETEVGSGEGYEGFQAVVAVGTEVPVADGTACIRCSFDMTQMCGEGVVAPGLTSKDLARAAVLLLPSARKFSVISETEGAADVQDACDVLDMSGVDYTVEAVNGGVYGDAVFAAAEKGCDVLLLPTGKLGEVGVDLSGYNTQVIAVGAGEPVRGALASFCIDAKRMAYEAVQHVMYALRGEEPEGLGEGFVLCINRSIAKELEVDIRSVSEDFPIAFIE